MEVPGRNYGESFAVTEKGCDMKLFCIPCDIDGSRQPAFGFCEDCQEHLCESCFRCHTRPTPMRGHVLVDSNRMPKVQLHGKVKDDIEFCKTHEKEHIKFYCEKHKSTLCSVCATIQHRECKLSYIPDITLKRIQNGEICLLLGELEDTRTDCKNGLAILQGHLQRTESNHSKICQQIKMTREDLNKRLDNMEKNILTEAQDWMNSESNKVMQIQKSLQINLKELDICETRTKHCQENRLLTKLFLQMEEGSLLLQHLKKDSEKVKGIEDGTYAFSENKFLVNTVTREQLGRLMVQPQNIILTREKELDEAFVSKEGDITGIVVLENKELVLIDNFFTAVRLISVKDNKLIAEIKLDNGYRPYDAVSLPDSELAVTLQENGIAILGYTTKELRMQRVLSAPFNCYGISHHQGKFVVTSYDDHAGEHWDDGKIIIMDVQGKLLRCICENELVHIPRYVKVSRDGKYLIVTVLADKVVKLDWLGNLVDELKVGEFPSGLEELEDGTFLIPTWNGIFRLTQDSQCTLLKSDEVNVLRYCKKTQRLFASTGDSETGNCGVSVYKVTWFST